jgi:hypothetical protein
MLRPYMQFMRIGGRMHFPPPLFATVQTDGSFGSLGARVATVIHPADELHTWRYIETISAMSSAETEWASIECGIRRAIDAGESAMGVENDNLGVIHGLVFPLTPLKHAYARYWRSRIADLTKDVDWVGVRWIPRELNRADDLFRH